MAKTQLPDGRWAAGSLRPPMGGGDVLATASVLQSLRLYSMAGHEAELHERVDRAAKWLTEYKPRYHQERVFQLLGLGRAGLHPDDVRGLTHRLLETQNKDSGWSQLPELPSDAWATGESLVALHIVGGLPTSCPAYRKGLEFLLNSQFEDGSWFVKSRSDPFQPPFESGFPFGRDQWVSAAATAWAVMALTLAVEPREARLPSAIGNVEHSSANPSVAELEAPANQAESRSLRAERRRSVQFDRDVRPFLERSCVACHSGDEPQANLAIMEYESLLKSGDSGTPAVTLGLSDDSRLFLVAAGTAGDLVMPPENERETFPALTPEELAALKQWIDDGAPWPAEVVDKAPEN